MVATLYSVAIHKRLELSYSASWEGLDILIYKVGWLTKPLHPLTTQIVLLSSAKPENGELFSLSKQVSRHLSNITRN